jgi:hypothetical protein
LEIPWHFCLTTMTCISVEKRSWETCDAATKPVPKYRSATQGWKTPMHQTSLQTLVLREISPRYKSSTRILHAKHRALRQDTQRQRQPCDREVDEFEQSKREVRNLQVQPDRSQRRELHANRQDSTMRQSFDHERRLRREAEQELKDEERIAR